MISVISHVISCISLHVEEYLIVKCFLPTDIIHENIVANLKLPVI